MPIWSHTQDAQYGHPIWSTPQFGHHSPQFGQRTNFVNMCPNLVNAPIWSSFAPIWSQPNLPLQFGHCPSWLIIPIWSFHTLQLTQFGHTTRMILVQTHLPIWSI